MKQKMKIILILIFAVTLINVDVCYIFTDLPNVQESVHLENARGHASSVCRVIHASEPVKHTKGIACKNIIYSAITEFLFENTKVLIYIWQFPRANILS